MDASPRNAPEPSGPPIVNIVGEKVALGPMRRDLILLYQRWINDFEVTRTLAIPSGPMTREAEEQWFEHTSTNLRDRTFTIYERATWRPLGVTDLRNVDHFQRTADFGIMIGERDCWGQGFGTQATSLMLDYGFNVLGLHNIMLTVYDYNARGLRAYTRAGFRIIGRRREARRLGGQPHDEIMMDCLATEFESPVLRRMFVDPG